MNQLQNFQRYSSLSTRPPQYTLIPDLQTHQLLRLPVPSLNSTYHPKKSPAFDYVIDPTKRVKHTPNSFSESLLKLNEIPYEGKETLFENSSRLSQNDEAMRFLYLNQQLLASAGNPKMDRVSDFQAGFMKIEDSRIPNLNGEFIIPPLNGYGIGKEFSRYLPSNSEILKEYEQRQYEMQEKMRRQLMNQTSEGPYKQEFFQQRDKQDFENLVQQQLIQQMQFKRLQFDQALLGMKEHGKLNEQYHDLTRSYDARHLMYLRQIQALQEANLEKIADFGECSSLKTDTSNKTNFPIEPISFEDNSEKLSNNNEIEIPGLKVEFEANSYKIQEQYQRKASFSFERQKENVKAKKIVPQFKPRKKRTKNSEEEYSKTLQENRLKKTREGPRRRNKWQEITYDPNIDVIMEEKQAAELKPIEVDQNGLSEAKGTKPRRPQELPQHMQDDSLIDYKALIRVMITNDPIYTGTDNDSSNFVVVKKEIKERNMDEQVEKTKVGSQYQAAIPKLEDESTRSRRRHPEMVWGPGTIRENELRRYFGELYQLLRCEDIHEERALKLLRRKKYKKDKVLINVSKNEKFYSSYLIAGNMLNMPTENDVP